MSGARMMMRERVVAGIFLLHWLDEGADGRADSDEAFGGFFFFIALAGLAVGWVYDIRYYLLWRVYFLGPVVFWSM